MMLCRRCFRENRVAIGFVKYRWIENLFKLLKISIFILVYKLIKESNLKAFLSLYFKIWYENFNYFKNIILYIF